MSSYEKWSSVIGGEDEGKMNKYAPKKKKEKKGRRDGYERGVRQHCFQIYKQMS